MPRLPCLRCCSSSRTIETNASSTDGAAHRDPLDRVARLRRAHRAPSLRASSTLAHRDAQHPAEVADARRRRAACAAARPRRRRARARRSITASARAVDDLLGRADREQLAAEDERQPVAALGLVHVVRGHEHGRALVRDAVDLIPELAPADRVDARGRLVEEQQRRLVDRRAGQRDALLPAARERAGDLVAPIAQARSAPAPLRCARAWASCGHVVDAAVEVAGSPQTVRSSYRLKRCVM